MYHYAIFGHNYRTGTFGANLTTSLKWMSLAHNSIASMALVSSGSSSTVCAN